ncbi:MAG TPA: chalcone isomerase family protein [Anaeromyxobacteraceae bacterium]|nr:chalcone isomerase family protein [Anaeromyxobacteraceae bacterium]
MSPSLLAALVLLLTAPGTSREVSGVEVPGTFTAGGQELKLNGAGLRRKFIVNVYVGALYLAELSHDAEAVVAVEAPKAVRMAFLRDVTRSQMMGAFREGFENNTKEGLSDLLAKLSAVEGSLPNLKRGEVLVVRYEPGQGSTIGVEGQPSVTVPGKDFADALFRCWLGPRPADDSLKKAMLGG